MRRLGLLLCALALAGCGGSGRPATTTKAATPDPAATLRKLVAGSPHPLTLLTPASRKRVAVSELSEGVEAFDDQVPVHAQRLGGGWAVAWTSGTQRTEGMTAFRAYGVAERLVGGRWLADMKGPVRLNPLGPDGGSVAAAQPQVAVEIKASDAITETALFVDGTPIDTKSGGPSSRYISIYGAPAAPLPPDRHVAVAWARAGSNASATAWWFRVK